jgi:hypothetical protein
LRPFPYCVGRKAGGLSSLAAAAAAEENILTERCSKLLHGLLNGERAALAQAITLGAWRGVVWCGLRWRGMGWDGGGVWHGVEVAGVGLDMVRGVWVAWGLSEVCGRCVGGGGSEVGGGWWEVGRGWQKWEVVGCQWEVVGCQWEVVGGVEVALAWRLPWRGGE